MRAPFVLRAACVICFPACIAILACRGEGDAAARAATAEAPAETAGTGASVPAAVRDTVPTTVRGVCRTAGNVVPGLADDDGAPVPSMQIAHVVEGGPAQALRCVARTEAELERLRAVVGIPDSVARRIDLEGGIVVAATMGTQPTAGHDIFVGSARTRGDTLWVGVHAVLPAGPASEDLITAPADVVVIPRRTPNVVFFDH
jgi:hypothetical protein